MAACRCVQSQFMRPDPHARCVALRIPVSRLQAYKDVVFSIHRYSLTEARHACPGTDNNDSSGEKPRSRTRVLHAAARTRSVRLASGRQISDSLRWRRGDRALSEARRYEGTKAEHTAISFSVDDIVAEVRDLEARGVRFHDYDLPGLKTIEHVCLLGAEKAAWFSDPEGNILCLREQLPTH